MRISDWSSDVCSSDLPFTSEDCLLNSTSIFSETFVFSPLNISAYEWKWSMPPAPFGNDAFSTLGGRGGVLPIRGTVYRSLGLRSTSRSEERRAGNVCVSTGRYRWSQYN